MRNKKIRVYHYNRLFDEELENIKKEGLKPFDKDLVDFKLGVLEQYNILNKEDFNKVNEEVREFLREENYSDRFGKISVAGINDYKKGFVNTINWMGDVLFGYIYDECGVDKEMLEIGKKINKNSKPYRLTINIPLNDLKAYTAELREDNYQNINIYVERTIISSEIIGIDKII